MQVAKAKYRNAGNFNRCNSIREVQRLGRTAKEIAAEIGEELTKVKASLKHGEFAPWVEENCTFAYRGAAEYMQVAKTKSADLRIFERCSSIREVLDYKTKPAPKQEHRAATLDDLRKVERLRAQRWPVCRGGEAVQAKMKKDCYIATT